MATTDTTRFVPDLGQLLVVEVYEYYDEPVLFCARSDTDQLFLAVLSEDPKGGPKTWLYAPLSRAKLENLRNGAVSLYEAFRFPEDGLLLRTSGDSSEWVRAHNLGGDKLPLQGTLL